MYKEDDNHCKECICQNCNLRGTKYCIEDGGKNDC